MAAFSVRLTTSSLLFLITLLVSQEITCDHVELFERFSLTVIRGHTNYNKPPSGHRRSPRAPDLYLNVYAIQKAPDGSDTGKDIFMGKTKVVKNTHRPVFNETFAYERDHSKPYSIGTDGLLRIHLYDQSPGLKTPDEDLGFFDIALGIIHDDVKAGIEMMGQMEAKDGSKSHIAYKIDYKIDSIGRRESGGGMDDDFNHGIDPMIKKTSSGKSGNSKQKAAIGA